MAGNPCHAVAAGHDRGMMMRFLLRGIAVLMPVVLAHAAEPALKTVFKDDFRIGVAANPNEIREDGKPGPQLSHHFNAITPCNVMKWSVFNPAPGQYETKAADELVDFGSRHGILVVGHVLFWHEQTPDWVFQGDDGKQVTREVLLERMRERVRFVAKRYGKRVQAWDVVNEAIENNGRLRQSKWVRIIGEDFIEQAFRIAGEELPEEVELIYNDYTLETPAKRDAVVKMIGSLRSKGIRIDAVATQAHWSLDSPGSDQIEASIVAFANAGVKVHVSELDIDVLPRHKDMWNPKVAEQLQKDPKMNPYAGGLPDDIQGKLAKRYAEVFALFLKHHDKIDRVTMWGTNDGSSWLNQFPIQGRTNHPLLFDREGRPKPAFDAVAGLTRNKATP